jgi:hypothetical protein
MYIQRKPLYEELQSKRQSKVVTYVTGIGRGSRPK